MKVYIGPYRTTHISTYTFFDRYISWKYEKPYWQVKDDEYTKTDKFVERICDITQDVLNATINKLIGNRERDVKVRIDPYDTWSMDHTLALIVHPMLVQLRDTNHGFFQPDVEDVPHIGVGEETDYGHSDTKAQDRYNWVMDELIWTFEQLKNDNDYDLFYSDEKGWNREAMDAHHERIKNGLRLFGKYYRALWD
jgi:hypothetical protein